MSYNRINGWLPAKPMLYDILAIQTLYGVNSKTAEGNNTGVDAYRFKTGADAVQAIWDAGGKDTIDASDKTESEPVTIDLRPGHFSFVGELEGNSQQLIAIAYRVEDPHFNWQDNWIENAIGGKGDDKLIGNDAANELTGGQGNDTLEGGAGNDTYIYATGDGVDKIIDHEGSNQLQINGTVVSGAFTRSLDGGNVYHSEGKTYEFRQLEDGVYRLSVFDPTIHDYRAVFDLDSTQAAAGQGYQAAAGLDGWLDGAFGITTLDTVEPVDRVMLSFPNSTAYLNMNGSDYNAQPGVPAPRGVEFAGGTKNDSFKGTYYSDIISTGDGVTPGDSSNYADASYGDDQVKGGNGRDYLVAGYNISSLTYSDNDIAFGGAQTDVLLGGYGSDQLWGDADDGNWEFAGANSTERGDWLSGEKGNDSLYGSSSMDVLFGGAGEDLLQGGAGDDLLLGDAQYTPSRGTASLSYAGSLTVSYHWSSTANGGAGGMVYATNATTYSTDPVLLVNGTAFRWTVTTTNDDYTLTPEALLTTNLRLVASGGGGDILYGGLGNDWMAGQTGDDYLEGGDGNDILYGDDKDGLMAVTDQGDDVVLGGAGNDILYGGAGDDILGGGAGDDTIYGGTGKDIIFFNRGDGHDTVVDPDQDTTLIFGEGITADDITLHLGSLALDLGNGDEVHIEGLDFNDVFNSSGISHFGFADGTVLTLADLLARGFDIVGTAGDDILTGTNTDDRILGLAGNDSLIGGAGNDILSGGDGLDYFEGGAGDDLYLDVATQETLYDIQGNNTIALPTASGLASMVLVGGASLDITLNSGALLHLKDVFLGGHFTLQLGNGLAVDLKPYIGNNFATAVNLQLGNTGGEAYGGAAADTLRGGAGDDILDGQLGSDSLIGGGGNDTYVVGTGDTVTEAANAGIDTVQTDISYTVGVNVENLTLTGTAAVNGTGNGLANILTGNSAANTLAGGNGNDTYVISTGDTVTEAANKGTDTVQSDISYTIGNNVENLSLTGTAAVDGTGNALNNSLVGNGADNTLDGGLGSDTLAGGDGDDGYFVDNALDVVIEAANAGVDTVNANVTYTLADNVENLSLTGAALIDGTGNGLDNVLAGNSAANALVGGAGNDTYVISTGDTVNEAVNEGVDTIQTDISYTLGGNLENLLLTGATAINGTGNSLDNVLAGNSAANSLVGGIGNDTYVVSTGDTVTEASGEGTDTVQTDITYTLGNNVENLTLIGTAAVNGIGNALNNSIVGNNADNTLNGGAGKDTMAGGFGDDLYFVNTALDIVTEAAYAGTDTVNSNVAYTLADHVENLTLTGAGAVNGTGNGLDNVLTGNSAANALVGGVGNDTYVIGTGDTVTEATDEGVDTVQTDISYTLGNNVENLTLTGAVAVNGTGNGLDNVLAGNSAANVLVGGLGNDTYVAGTGDTVTEALNEGIDTVQTDISYTLGGNVENLTLTGAAAVNGTGNGLDNVLAGNSAANVLVGGIGNDTYVISTGDTVTEATNEGTDTVLTDITYSLGGNLENLTLAGITAINGTGNTLNNTLVGNSADNTLDGGAGRDAMAGGDGNDVYVVNTALDTVTEAANEGIDTVKANVAYSLGGNVENLTLIGAAAVNGTGNALDNILAGNSAANVLVGGLGNDTYVISTGDTVTEATNEGADTVQTDISYTLGSNIENLTLLGTSAINGTGNAQNNVLNGNINTAVNILTGGAGDDIYVLGTGDTMTEAAGEGTDTVQVDFTFSLAGKGGIENLTLLGTADINATGNTLNNALTGNGAANILNGGYGNDILTGGTGIDGFVFNATLNAANNKDIIADFDTANETITLENAIFAKFTTVGAISAGSFASGANAAALDNDDYLIYNTTTGALSYDADGNGAGAQIDFVTLTGIPSLTLANFVVI